MAEGTQRERDERRKSALKLELSSFLPHYKDLSQFIQPRKGRFFIDDRNRGGDRYQAIINSKATTAWRTARSGFMAGVMSPSSPWWEYETPDPELMDFYPVKVWLYQVQRVLNAIMASSNLYSMSATMFGEMILFATGAMVHVDDFEDVARFYTLTAGSYMIGQDDRQEINTLVREWEMTTSQLINKFAKKGGKVSISVQTAYDKGDYDMWFPITHIIEPNALYDESKKLSKFKQFRSCYYEAGNLDKDATLSEKGFDYFPAYCPRWDVTGEDIYGTDCPAMIVLGDIKGLQIEERRKAQAIDKMVAPPMKGNASMRNVPIDSLPGGLTIYDGDPSKDGISPLYQVNPNVQELRLDMKAVEERIDTGFFLPLFRAISDMPGIQPKNKLELTQRDQERLLELGPVLEHLHEEYLRRVVDNIFDQAVRAGILPPPPKELQGLQIKPKFISALATAQKAVAAGTIERNATFIAGLVSSGFQHAADKFDVNEAIDGYASVTGLPPKMVVPNSIVDANSAAAAKAAGNQDKLKAVGAMAGIAKTGAEAVKAAATSPTDGNSVLKAVGNAVKQRYATNLFQPKV